MAMGIELTVDDAKHKLVCRHKCGNSDKIYHMPCVVLGSTKSGKLKVLVFGRLFWKDTRNEKRIRYVDADRVSIQGATMAIS